MSNETQLKTSIGNFDRFERPVNNDKRRHIQIPKGKLAVVVDDAEQALIVTQANVFTRGGELVRVVENSVSLVEKRSDIQRPNGAPLIMRQTAVSLADTLNRVTLFLKWYERGGGWKPTDCPKEVAETLLSRVGLWRLRPLAAVITAPTLRFDGTILSKPGYDATTGFLLIGDMKLPHISTKPTRKNAKNALAALESLLGEFPFAGEVDHSAALAMLLTATFRPSLPTAPMFAITAPTPGTGKSYLADIAAALATGRKAAVVAADCDEEELDKRVSSSLMAGDAVLNLDNISQTLRSSFLCQALSQETVKCRILGRSVNMDTPTNALLIATGNALRVHGDLTRRVLLIRLDAREEHPELRQFERNPIKDAIADRPKYVAAALTILRAFITSGDVVDLSPLGSFNNWSDWVRKALVWLNLPDPVDAMEAARGTDPERERTSEILAALLPEGNWVAKGLERRLNSADANSLNLSDALAGFKKHGQFDKHAFGNWCRKHQNRPVDGMRLVEAGFDAKAKVRRWRVEKVY